MSAPSVLVTGGGRGIGRAIALRCARQGSTVVVAARSSDQLDAVVASVVEVGGRGLAAVMDVRDAGSVASGVQRAVEFCGGTLDLLVNNAGVFDVVPFDRLDLATWRRSIEVHLDGTFHVTRACLPALLAGRRGHIVNMASVAARRAFPGNVAYCASKYGLRGFSDALRLDLAPQGIRVTTVYPGPTDTTIFEGVPGDWNRATMNRPEDVAEVVWQAWSAAPDVDVADLVVPPPA